MLPPDLQFFKSPDSSCFSSFPNTPCDSVDGSQSSTASFVDEAASVSLPTANTDKQLVNAKRRMPPLRSNKLAKPAKVSLRLNFMFTSRTLFKLFEKRWRWHQEEFLSIAKLVWVRKVEYRAICLTRMYALFLVGYGQLLESVSLPP